MIWTDCFQSLCMFGSYLGIIIYGSQRLGGAARVFDLNYQAGRVELFSLDPDPRQRHTLWGLLVGTLVLWVSVYGTNQAMVQRYSTVRKRSQVVNSLWLTAVLMAGLIGLCSYGGMVMFAFYRDCDPVTAGQVEKKDQMFPLFVMQMVGDIPGLPGLFVAGVFRYLYLSCSVVKEWYQKQRNKHVQLLYCYAIKSIIRVRFIHKIQEKLSKT